LFHFLNMASTVCPTGSICLPSVYYLFVPVVVIGYETTAAARRALLFIVRPFFNNAITIAVWTGLHVRLTGDATTPLRYIRWWVVLAQSKHAKLPINVRSRG
jgi:hypothetical protein